MGHYSIHQNNPSPLKYIKTLLICIKIQTEYIGKTSWKASSVSVIGDYNIKSQHIELILMGLDWWIRFS